MKFAAAVILAASATLATGQIVLNADGSIKCQKALAGSFCLSNPAEAKVIVTCDDNGIGSRGLCTEFLAGKPPYGSDDAVCHQSSDTAGDAGCLKGNVIYDLAGIAKSTIDPGAQSATYVASTLSTSIVTGSGGVSTLPCPLEPGVPVTSMPAMPTPEPAVPTIDPVLPSTDPSWPVIDPVPAPPVSGPPAPVPTPGVPIIPPVSGPPASVPPPGAPTIPPVSGPPMPIPSADPVPPPVGGEGGNSTLSIPTAPQTNTPAVQPPAATATVPTVPTSAAPVVKQAGAVMAAVGLAVVCLL